MKTLKFVGAVLVPLLILAGCSSPTGNKKDTGNPGGGDTGTSPKTLLDFEGAVDSTNWVNEAGYQSSMTGFPALTTSTLTDQGYREMDFLNGSHGASTWNDTGFVGSKALKFVIGATYSGPGGTGDALDSHALMNFRNLDLTDLHKYTGIKFSVLVPHDGVAADEVHNVGFTVLLRKVDGTNENYAVYAANLSQAESSAGLLGNTDGSQSDWTYWGDNAVFTFQVPFDYFRVPGWLGGAANEPSSAATVADALTAGVIFNAFDLDFRFNSGGDTYTDDHQYTAYIDNVTLY